MYLHYTTSTNTIYPTTNGSVSCSSLLTCAFIRMERNGKSCPIDKHSEYFSHTTNQQPPMHLLLIFSLLILNTFTPTTTTLTALPPGYEDEILCHPGATSCLRRRPQPRGWCGPRTAFVECCDVATGEVSRPRGWGVLVEAEYKEELVRQGWGVVGKCSDEEALMCGGGGKKNSSGLVVVAASAVAEMEGVVDRLLGLEMVGTW